MMDTRETEERSDQDWQTVRDASKRLEEHITIIVKVTDGTALQELPPDCVGPSVVHAAALTTTEKKDTYVKVRTVQNLIAVDSYRPKAIEKLLRIRQISIMGTQHPVLTYQVNGTNTVKGVIHGIQCAVTEEELEREVEVQGAKILQIRRIGSSKTILITLEGTYLPRYALYCRLVVRMFPYRPRSMLCTSCLQIGHGADVCPYKKKFVACAKCGTKQPPGSNDDTPHDCELCCRNCGGEHAANYPDCPVRQEADEARREAARSRKQRYLNAMKDEEPHEPAKQSGKPKNKHRSRSRSPSRTNWPELPTRNRFERLSSPEKQRDRSASHSRDNNQDKSTVANKEAGREAPQLHQKPRGNEEKTNRIPSGTQTDKRSSREEQRTWASLARLFFSTDFVMMDCEVEGEILTPEDFTKDSGWQLVAARRSTRRRNAAANQTGADVVEVQPNAGSNARCRPDHAGIKSKIIRGGRMPPLPKEEAKIIVRPRGGLCISKVGPTAVADAIWQAAGLDSATRDTDTMCPNFQQNIMVPEPSHHPDLSPPPQAAGGNRPSFGPIWCDMDEGCTEHKDYFLASRRNLLTLLNVDHTCFSTSCAVLGDASQGWDELQKGLVVAAGDSSLELCRGGCCDSSGHRFLT
ncbi:hypothetical protein HPB49_009761 [Dermacentor silvarum]|uniref:Uncharacterized protein n=1 Tax=Dermacentor silvarum TaxID=543639 RepID=A0ACB8CEH1_DERSI|nr:hypothetical protein HPB49_009761 [Dermacentor silvarum]